jgi:hypothetical protein
MNRALSPRDRGNRVANPRRTFRPAGVMPSVIRPVGGASHPRRPETAQEVSRAVRPLGCDMRGLTRRLHKLEAIRPPVFCDGGVVTDVALKKLSLSDRKLLQEAARSGKKPWRKRSPKPGFPVRITARDWDFRDDELEDLEQIHLDA